MPASGKEQALSQATNALLENRLELFEVKYCEIFDDQKNYSHGPETVRDIRKTANIAHEKQQLKIGGYIDPEIEEEEL